MTLVGAVSLKHLMVELVLPSLSLTRIHLSSPDPARWSPWGGRWREHMGLAGRWLLPYSYDPVGVGDLVGFLGSERQLQVETGEATRVAADAARWPLS